MPALSVLAQECDVCGATVQELRRGRCWGCYARWVDARPVGLGARCIVCNERRRRLLRSVELHAAWHPMCFACTGQAMSLAALPPSVPELKLALTRERRQVDRRFGKGDTRVFQYERRVGQRRAGRDDAATIDDDMIIEITIEDSVVEPVNADVPSGSHDIDVEIDFDDLTRIRDLGAAAP